MGHTGSSSAPTGTPGASSAGVITIERWQHLRWLRAGFSTRQGGRTTVYGSGEALEQNLGWTAEDPGSIVAENRRGFVSSFGGFEIGELITIRQLHGDVIRLVERGAPLSTLEGKAVLSGDGLITIQPGHLLGVQTADCVPVLLADKRTHAVGAVHAGWRGTLARIVERAVDAMRREFNSQPEDIVAAIGPSIGACCFAVGDEVESAFRKDFSYARDLFSYLPTYDAPGDPASAASDTRPAPKLHLDLWNANRRQLLAAGIPAEAITVVGECTACARIANGQRKYFSHRAEQGFTGRMLSVIGVLES